LRRKALEKLTLAIAEAVDSASDDTLADIVGSTDLRHALTIAPRHIPPPPPNACRRSWHRARRQRMRAKRSLSRRAE